MLRKVARMPLRARIDPKMLPRLHSTVAAPDSDEVLFRSYGAVREISLNRPKKLNAINENVVDLIHPRLTEYVKSDLVGVTVLRGEGGRALSAGGDVAALAIKARDEGLEASASSNSRFFRKEFGLNHQIATYPKPYVAFMDGITMGGGVGLAIHGSFRIATEKTLMAMPETTIGYYPDVGGIWFLSKLDDELGLFLALTSERVAGYDAYKLGLATHYVGSSRLPELHGRLTEFEPGNRGTTPANSPEYFSLINDAIEDFATEPPLTFKSAAYLEPENRDLISKCFKYDTAEEIVHALKNAGTEFATKTAETIESRCPTSIKVTLSAFRRFRALDIRRAFEQEMNVANHFMLNPNFPEGVLSLLVDKRKPEWKPATLAEVPESSVQEFFEPLPEFEPLQFANENTFKEYPHKFGLPSTADIKAFVIGETSPSESKATRGDVQRFFRNKLGDKLGLEAHIDEVLQRNTRPDSSDAELLDWNY